MNRACTFIGHHDCPENIIPELRKQIEKMILSGIDTFSNAYQFYEFAKKKNLEIINLGKL